MADQDILCVSCNRNFLYTEREQVFLKDLHAKGRIEEVVAPKRCMDCRRLRRAAAPGQEPLSASFSVPLSAPLSMPLEIKALPPPAAKPELPENGHGHAPEPDIRCVLIGADFEKLVCREEVVVHQGNRKIRLILANIGLPAMKEAMEKAVLAWWKS